MNYCEGKLDQCECTDYYIYCNNQGMTDIAELDPYIKTTLSSVKVMGNEFEELPENLFGACTIRLPALKRINLASNNIRTIHYDTFSCFDDLDKLILRNNSLQVDEFLETFNVQATRPRYLDLASAFDETDGIFDSKKLSKLIKKDGMAQAEYLDLSDNGIQSLFYDAGTAFCDLLLLKYLNLSHNSLRNPMLRDCIPSLEVLDLAHNSIDHLTPSLMDSLDAISNLKTLKLDNNPYYCDCSIQGMVDWLKSSRQPFSQDSIVCKAGDPSVLDQPVVTVSNVSRLECQEPRIAICPGVPVYVAKSSLIYIFIAAGLIGVGAPLLVLVIYVVKRRRKQSGGLSVSADKIPSRKLGPPYKPLV